MMTIHLRAGILACMSNWKPDFEKEYQRAVEARAKKNEGQARVCARRAAGIVAREYLLRKGRMAHSPSAYDLLKELAALEDAPVEARQAAELLVLRVDETFKLPVDADLLQLAAALPALLLQE